MLFRSFANSGGAATGGIRINSGSSLLSTGGNITLGGGYDGSQANDVYAASAVVGGAPGVLVDAASTCQDLEVLRAYEQLNQAIEHHYGRKSALAACKEGK